MDIVEEASKPVRFDQTEAMKNLVHDCPSVSISAHQETLEKYEQHLKFAMSFPPAKVTVIVEKQTDIDWWSLCTG